MNDQELDAQLRQLFESEAISVDAEGASAVALFDEIVGTAGQADQLPGRWVSAPPAHDESSATDLVVDLRRGFGPKTAELDSSRRLRRRITVAAILALVVLLTANVLLTQQDASSPVISEDAGDPVVEQDGTIEIIEGREEPLVFVVSGDTSVEAVDRCIELTASFDSPASSEAGWGAVAFASGVGQTDFAPSWTVINDVASLRECSDTTYSLTPAGLIFDNGRPVELITGGTSRQDVDVQGASAEVVIEVVGVINHEVVNVELVGVAEEDQIFRQLGGVFRIDAVHQGDDPALAVEVELSDGTIEIVEPAELTPPCQELDCLAEEIIAFSEAAVAGDDEEQADALADGVLTRSEYERADQRFQDCLLEGVGATTSPLVVRADAEAGTEVLDCWSAEIVFVEFARVAQNGVLRGLDGSSLNGAAAADEPVEEAPDLTQVARSIFEDGLDRDELQTLWDGYPYGAEETDERIEAFLSDFAWISGDIDVVVNLYEQFEGSGFFVPVVTVRAAGEPERAAVFVLGGTAQDLRIQRIPEADDLLLEYSLDERLDGTGTTIVIDRVGTEGGVSAYIGDRQLETEVDPIEFTTAISLPDDRPLPTLITVVSATPEAPAASVLLVD